MLLDMVNVTIYCEAICNDEFESFNQWKGTISITTRFPTQNQNLFDPKKQVLGVASFAVGIDADRLIEVPKKKGMIFGLSSTVVYIIIGVVVAVVLCLILSCFLWKKKSRAPQEYFLS
eukprot:GHVR01088447.1.p1 GENE.GHVR01088447.1~~GHVR01088447.1.p1  ORF type:complete len:118 (+),score=13.66 GHVR01088447.1:228-581(+)